MSGGVNKVIVIGNLGADPELRYTQGGQPVCELRVATNEAWTGKDGQRQERTEWHRVVVWGKQAENAAKYLSKGRQVYVEGKLQTRTWEDKQGQKRYTTEIVAREVVYLGGSDGRGRDRQDEAPPPRSDDGGSWGGGGAPSGQAGGFDDDIPF